jgi:capsular polysaccharide biosynthesis protein
MTQAQATAVKVNEAYNTVWRHRYVVLTTFAILIAMSVLLIALIPRPYKASANVLIVNGNTRNDPTLSSPDLPTLATSTGVLAQVEKNLGLNVPLLTLKRHLTAKPPPYRSGIMRIEYADPSPNRAAMIANGVADELATYYKQLSTARYDDDLRALDAELVKQKARIESIDAQLK